MREMISNLSLNAPLPSKAACCERSLGTLADPLIDPLPKATRSEATKPNGSYGHTLVAIPDKGNVA